MKMRAVSQLAIFCKSFAEKPKNKCYIPNFIVVVYPTLLFPTIVLKDLCFIAYLRRFHLAQTIPNYTWQIVDTKFYTQIGGASYTQS